MPRSCSSIGSYEGAPNEIAVLYRVNARSRGVERAMVRRGIPYRVVRGVEFFQRAEVKDLVAWLRLLANPRDGEAFAPYWEQWAAAEAEHFARHRTRERAHLVLDGAGSGRG